MRCIDKIRSHIKDSRAAGRLKPGDQLPTYHEMMGMFNASYSTISATINALAREGLLDVQHGNGTFLAGGQWLDVVIYSQASTIPAAKLEALLRRHLSQTELNIRARVLPTESLVGPGGVSRAVDRCMAALSLVGVTTEDQLPPAYLAQFEDYDQVLSTLGHFDGVSYAYGLPFCYCTYQMGVNRRLLGRLGMQASDLTMDFAWWDAFVARCAAAGVLPMTIDYFGRAGMYFDVFLRSLLTLVPFSEERYFGNVPLFDTPAGHRWLALVRDTTLITDHVRDPRNFYQNGAALTPAMGSWITVQNREESRPDKNVDELDLVPYREGDGRKFHLISLSTQLRAYWRPDAATADRRRIWELVKLMVSPAFQKDYCDATGHIATHNALAGCDYAWNPGGRWSDFIPMPEDRVYHMDRIASFSRRVMYSILLENLRRFGADLGETARRLDEKKLPFPHDDLSFRRPADAPLPVRGKAAAPKARSGSI